MRRKATVSVVSAVAGSALLIGAKVAIPALAGTHTPGQHAKTAYQPAVGCTPDDHRTPRPTSTHRATGERDDDGHQSTIRDDDGHQSTIRDDDGREDASQSRTGRTHGCHPRSHPPASTTPAPSSSMSSKPPTTPPAPTHTVTTPAPPPPPSATATTPACTTTIGNAVNVASPGVGAVTLTIKVCGGVLTTSTGSLSQSNYSVNNQAIPALNTLAVQYYKTNISMIHYSGATLTSNAYRASLQSALTKAGI